MAENLRIYDIVMRELDTRRIPQKRVASESGVPFSTVSKIAQRSVKDPSVHTVQKLFDFFITNASDEKKAA